MTTIPDDHAGAAAGPLLQRAAAAATSPDQAAALYRELLAASPEHLEGRLSLARLLERRGELDEAVTTLPADLRRSPVRKGLAPEAATHLAEALNLTGDLAGASAVLDRALQATPRDGKV